MDTMNKTVTMINAFNLSPKNRKRLVAAMDEDFKELKVLATQDGTLMTQVIFYYALVQMGCPMNFIERFSHKWDEVSEKLISQELTMKDLAQHLKEKGIEVDGSPV